ncbi:MAG: arsenate reductase family protein [Aquaticitalea sp.]
MGVISTNENEIKLYYSSENSLGKQTNAYVDASEKKILAIDISKTKVTGTQWIELARNLGVGVDQLIDKKHPDFEQNYGENVNMEEEDWLKVLDKMPVTLTYPIAIVGKKYVQLKGPADFVKYMKTEGENIDEQNPN